MVMNRGIEISIISQFDIAHLPEFPCPPSLSPSPPLSNDSDSNTTSTFVPIYPGSHIWFEYTIEPPHPPDAAYLFKLLINDKPITAWDCTEKHGYYGKMIYALESPGKGEDEDVDELGLRRVGFRFGNHEGGGCGYGDGQEEEREEEAGGGCIEIRVHRVEHRKRIRGEEAMRMVRESDGGDGRRSLGGFCGKQLQLINGGNIEPGHPRRRYKYQLLDPVDRPFAVFRFYYRTYEYLWKNNIIVAPVPPSLSRSSISSSSSIVRSDVAAVPDTEEKPSPDLQATVQKDKHTIVDHDDTTSNNRPSPQRKSIYTIEPSSPLHPNKHDNNTYYLPLSDSDESLSVIARDSIEDLSSLTATRSPQSPLRSKRFSLLQQRQRQHRTQNNDSDDDDDDVASQTRPSTSASSPRAKLKKKLTTLSLEDQALNDGNGNKKGKEIRPLSPFTSSGLLRRVVDTERSSSSATEARAQTVDGQLCSCLVNSEAGSELKWDGIEATGENALTQRSGNSLMRFLSRKVVRRA